MTDPVRVKAIVDTLVDRHYELLNKIDETEGMLRNIASYIEQLEQERDRLKVIIPRFESALKKIINTARLDPPAPDGSAQAFGARAHLEAVLIAQDALKGE